MSTINDFMLSRRSALALGLGGAASAAVFALTGCSDSEDAAATTAAATSEASKAVSIDTNAYDSLIASGPVAQDDAISANTWAKKVKDAGTLRVGGVETSTMFALLNDEDGVIRGFDAGLSQLLARYILGDAKTEVTQVTSDTRESVLQNDQVDTVFATYSITDDRKKVISFAGPYYTSQQAILVTASNKDINSVDDLAGKTVAAQSGSTGPSILEKFAPEATVQEFKTDEEARTALEQGRVDAYVIDQTMQLSSIVKNPGKYRLAGDPFGPEDKYGIGLPLNSDGVDFVNAFLKEIEDAGTWTDLWQICIGDRTDQSEAPVPPTIGA